MTNLRLLTIRGDSTQLLYDQSLRVARVGIDTIGVRGTLRERPDWSAFSRTNDVNNIGDGNRFTSSGSVILNGIKLSAHASSYHGPIARWEVSLPTWLNGHNLDPLAAEDALDCLRDIYGSASDFVSWSVPFEDLAVSRLDTDRDFHEVSHIDGLLQGLGCQRLPVRASRTQWSNGTDLYSISVQVQGRWKAQLYDKHRQLESLRPDGPIQRAAVSSVLDRAEGILRFECRTWNAVNRGASFGRIGGLNDKVLERHNRYYFDRCNFGASVGNRSTLRTAMERSLADGDSARLARAIGQLEFVAEGLPSPYSQPTDLQCRRLLVEVGISPADLVNERGQRLTLNYHEGRLEREGYATSQELAA